MAVLSLDCRIWSISTSPLPGGEGDAQHRVRGCSRLCSPSPVAPRLPLPTGEEIMATADQSPVAYIFCRNRLNDSTFTGRGGAPGLHE
jgi:hypothetical protein